MPRAKLPKCPLCGAKMESFHRGLPLWCPAPKCPLHDASITARAVKALSAKPKRRVLARGWVRQIRPERGAEFIWVQLQRVYRPGIPVDIVRREDE